MKNIANYITLGRILLTICLLFTSPLSAMFYVLYVLCGLSDMVDGILARKLKVQSNFGARFDTIADGLFLVVVIYKILPVIELKLELMIWCIIIALIKILAVAIVCIKHNTFGSIHTYMNKVTGFLLFIVPLLLKVVELKILISIVCTVALVAALEELAIDIMHSDLDLNRKGILFKNVARKKVSKKKKNA